MAGAIHTEKRIGDKKENYLAISIRFSIFTFCILAVANFYAVNLFAQRKEKVAKPFNVLKTFSTSNKYIWANVDGATGTVNVLLPPGRDDSPSLDFPDHSYFTAQIIGTYYTNNTTIDLPPNAVFLVDGITVKIADTVRTTWLNKNGVDIIQDIYPVLFTKSGQIVYKWKFHNHNGFPAFVGCQYLQDIQITDPADKSLGKSNDGPVILTKWAYKPRWLQYPDNLTSEDIPPFFIGFVHDLPNAPNFYPNLSGQGYLDYPTAPLYLIKPSEFTIGDWYTMTQTIFGASKSWPMQAPYGTSSQVDDALLIEFRPQGVPADSTVIIGKTSYGTGEYETCNGLLSSLVFYPHHLIWTKSNNPPPGFYTPNPIHIEKFVINPPDSNSAANTMIRLTVGDDMTISDSMCKADYGTSQVQPTSGPGLFLSPGDVGYFDWWVCVRPALFCTGVDIDSLIFTGTSSDGQPTFENSFGAPECEQLITLDCAEADQDPPLYFDTIYDCQSASVTVSDSRPTDRGLQSITWVAEKGTDTTKITVSAPVPPITPCYYDTLKHVVTVRKIDSTAKGCFDFTFTDCLGHKSFTTICLKACPLIPSPDSLPPVFTLIEESGTYDPTLSCDNNRIDSFKVTDNNKNDSGICSLGIVAGSATNMQLNVAPFPSSSGLVRFSVSVLDSMVDGDICIRATDCSKEAHVTDTCIHYCTIKDTLAPRISIIQTAPDTWHVTVTEDAPWDRLIDSIFIVSATANMTPAGPLYPLYLTKGMDTVEFDMRSSDTTIRSSFCIEANDLAGNRTPADVHCITKGISQDTLCPNILINPPLNTNPTAIWVNVNDIHFLPPPNDTSLYVWDSGIDKIFFTSNHGMNVPPPISANGKKQVDSFQISVINPLQFDTVACVTINATDMQGNTCSATYCFPYTQDTLPPVITLHYDPSDKSQILGVITDSTSADRGLDSIALFHNAGGTDTNLKWTNVKLLGSRLFTVGAGNAITRDTTQSSTGAMWAIDRWGAFYSPIAFAHSAMVNFAIWVQDFKMKQGILPAQGSSFSIPVYFVKNDSIPVIRKNITAVTLDFRMIIRDTGLLRNPIVFDSASIIGTEMEIANWNKPSWVVNPAGKDVLVTGSMGSGTPLDAKPLEINALDSLVVLYFHALTDASTREVDIEINQIVLNNGKDTLYTGTSSPGGISTALMPAPQGSLSGSVVVISGECSPQITDGTTLPTAVSLDPPIPNPFSHTTTFEYTVAQDGPVRLQIFDVLGQEIRTIVDENQKQGRYHITFDGGSVLRSGMYVARLQASGTVCSQRIGVEK